MPTSRVVRVRRVDDGVAAHALRDGLERIRGELGVTPGFPPEVEAAARASAAVPRLPALDRTDLPFVTIDPAGSRDLDQALHLRRCGRGFVLHYAIADVAAFVAPGDPVDLEAHRRGETLYGADSPVPLHPPAISEDAASLLPGVDRPAVLWTVTTDADGEPTSVRVERALVRSRAQLDYATAQRVVDDGTADEPLALLAELGRLRLAREADRGGVALPLPDQEVEAEDDRWRLRFRELLPVEEWNAQMSLLTGFSAAALMLEGRVGLLRTLPDPDPRDVARLARTARALGVPWPEGTSYPDLVRTLDPSRAEHAALLVASTRLLRGSGYVAFDGEVPGDPQHAALASAYAHVTAPLRRLGDRYAAEVCLALCAGAEVPGWVRAALPGLPRTLAESGRRASQYQSAVLDLVEAGALRHRVGEVFPAVVVDVDGKDPRRGTVTVQDPAVEARVVGERELPLGSEVRVRLRLADLATRRVEFAWSPDGAAPA